MLGPPAGRPVHPRSVRGRRGAGAGHALGAGCSSVVSQPLGISGPLGVQRALQRWAGGGGGGWAGGHGVREPSRRGEKEALQFGLVFVESALAPGGERPRLAPAPAPLRRWAVTEDPGGGGQVGTWQHPQGRAGLGGSAQALHTARSSGWASAELPGCLLKSDAAAK